MAGPSMTQKRKLAGATAARAAAKRPKPATESPRISEVTKSPCKNQLLKFGGIQEPDVGDAFINPTAMSYFTDVKVSTPFCSLSDCSHTRASALQPAFSG